MTQAPRMTPPAAIVIPAHDAAETVGRAVASALAQEPPCEVVVVDDASTDGTAEAARRADDGTGRLAIVTLPRNVGPAAARNIAIAASGAPWIALLDSDDRMEPGRIAALLGLAATGEWDLIGDDLWKVAAADPEGPRTRLVGPALDAPRALTLAGFVAGNLRGRGGPRRELGFLKPLMRREFLAARGLRYDEAMRLGEDYDLYARALAAGARFRVGPPLGYVAVVREASLSGTHRTADLGRVVAADRRLLALPGIDGEARRTLRRHLEETRQEWHWRRLIDAVKARAPGEAAACLAAPPATLAYLAARLGEQAWLRGRRRAVRLLGGPRREAEGGAARPGLDGTAPRH